MPKELRDVRDFLKVSRRPDAKKVIIYSQKKKGVVSLTKFKMRCSRYLYTLSVRDREKAQKLEGSLPPSLAKTHYPKKK